MGKICEALKQSATQQYHKIKSEEQTVIQQAFTSNFVLQYLFGTKYLRQLVKHLYSIAVNLDIAFRENDFIKQRKKQEKYIWRKILTLNLRKLKPEQEDSIIENLEDNIYVHYFLINQN